MFRKRKPEPQARQAAKPTVKLTAAEKREISRILETARGDGKVHSAQDTLPFRQMYPDGLCKLDDHTWSKCIEFEDVNYQLAKPDDQTAIFEALCDMYAHKVNFVRYADDFVVTAATPELALEAKELIREFLAERGLELSDEKTVVTNIDDGFDFLGWNFRKYNEKLIIKPSKKAVKAIVSNISDTILRRGKAWQQDVLIMKLNEQIRGWTNYHQSVCASDAFAHLDYVLYELLWRWAKRRHPKKNKWWISTRYWHRVGNRNWVFSTENKELIRVDSTAIVRHTKIKATANPFLDMAYFQKRKFDKGMHRLTGKFKTIWKNQNGLCYHCGMPMDVTEEREIFYLAPKAKAGMEDVRNMRYVHCTCQRIYAENRLKK